jgi:predicted nucleic acid-binding protein
MIVIADSAPINYLVLIGESDLLPRLYEGVAIPTAVLMELRSTGALAPVSEVNQYVVDNALKFCALLCRRPC